MRDIPFEKTVGVRILLEKQVPESLREAAERIALAVERPVQGSPGDSKDSD